MPQRSIVRKRKKARATKQLAEWREKQDESKAAGSEKKKSGTKKSKD